MNNKKTISFLLSFLLVVLGCLFLIFPLFSSQDSKGPFRVKRVVDGDTIVLDNGRHVRYVGINTPERGERFWREAKNCNTRKVGGKAVTLEFGQVREDTYGRTLAYVTVEDDMVNAHLLKEGWAHLFVLEPIIYYDHFRRLQEEARAQGLGIWRKDGFTGPLKITTLHADAQGDDRYNLNGEYVRICNISPQDIDLRGFSLVDLEEHRYIFPRGSLRPGYTALLVTGTGKDIAAGADQLSFYWNSPYPIWNNKGDQAFLRGPQGELIDNVVYRKEYSN
ncbi:MAG: thermonuclease family protein [Deltaproteobacteria bacterium]|nr:thermonuclease family protein [Deltaproteobacteria bacterium]